MDRFGLVPRDCRLLATVNAHIAVRDHYFLFRFPPFTGTVHHDGVLLIADRDIESQAAAEALEQRLIRYTGAAAGGETTREQTNPLPPGIRVSEVSFEHKVLEAVLSEDTLFKRDRYTRLSALIHAATSPQQTHMAQSIITFYQSREASLYRLLTLSRSLSALQLDVKRSAAALAQLLSSDEDMAGPYLTALTQCPHHLPLHWCTLLTVCALRVRYRHLPHLSSAIGPRPANRPAHGRGADARIVRDGARGLER